MYTLRSIFLVVLAGAASGTLLLLVELGISRIPFLTTNPGMLGIVVAIADVAVLAGGGWLTARIVQAAGSEHPAALPEWRQVSLSVVLVAVTGFASYLATGSLLVGWEALGSTSNLAVLAVYFAAFGWFTWKFITGRQLAH